MKKILLIITGLSLLFFAGCTSTPVVANYGAYGDVVTQDHAQQALFDGRAYRISGHSTLNTGETIELLGCTGDKAVHFENFLVSMSSTPADVHLYENPVINTTGTQIYGFNQERNFADEHELLLYANPNLISVGNITLVHTTVYGGNKEEGSVLLSNELILKTNTCYTFEIENLNGNGVDYTYTLLWYESEFDRSYYYN